MISGRLRHRIQYKSKTNSIGGNGENTITWSTYTSRWADIRSIGGREREQGEQLTGEVTHEIFARFTSGLLPEMRVEHGSRVFNILRILPDRTNEKNQRLEVKEDVD